MLQAHRAITTYHPDCFAPEVTTNMNSLRQDLSEQSKSQCIYDKMQVSTYDCDTSGYNAPKPNVNSINHEITEKLRRKGTFDMQQALTYDCNERGYNDASKPNVSSELPTLVSQPSSLSIGESLNQNECIRIRQALLYIT